MGNVIWAVQQVEKFNSLNRYTILDYFRVYSTAAMVLESLNYEYPENEYILTEHSERELIYLSSQPEGKVLGDA